MTLSRRKALKIGLGAGALPLVAPHSLLAPVPLASPDGLDEKDVLRARPLPLAAVRLTGGPLKHAQDLDVKYLLELEPDRLLAYYRERAGLERKAEPYTGWDGGGRNLTGHFAGHYLSAVSGRPGTRYTRPTPACGTPTGSLATEPPWTLRSSSPPGPRRSSPASRTPRSSR